VNITNVKNYIWNMCAFCLFSAVSVTVHPKTWKKLSSVSPGFLEILRNDLDEILKDISDTY